MPENSRLLKWSILILLIASAAVLSLVFRSKILETKQIMVSFDEKLANSSVMGKYFASKKSKKYYFPWCYSAEIMKTTNRVVLKSKREAEAKGYVKSKVCNGLLNGSTRPYIGNICLKRLDSVDPNMLVYIYMRRR